ncbi:MAG: DUF951 domain-containing protein [Firmicutes bacterium]|jgi:hypothetical protein|nr:DUF951 domain-containing protein [Bacillota bacterium]MDD4336455.1 DUF951 domain-containing protein [Bacillota bacterium]MDD4791859.1 DUF951 domain-containing protein [Bacillota bacterium]
MSYRVGDVVRMKKPHPCGSSTWKILRVGADFRIKCTGCGRVVMLPRPQFMKNVRGIADSGLGGDADSKSGNRGPA